MKKFFLTALIAAQGLFAVPGKTQEQNCRTGDTLNKEVSEGKLAVVFGTFSYRPGDNPAPNPVNYSRFSVNPGLGLEYRLSNHFHISAGLLRNNDWTASAYTMVGAETSGKKVIGIGAEVGAIGWRGASSLVFVPYLRLGSRDGRLNVKLNALQTGPRDPLTFGAQLRWNLGKR